MSKAQAKQKRFKLRNHLLTMRDYVYKIAQKVIIHSMLRKHDVLPSAVLWAINKMLFFVCKNSLCEIIFHKQNVLKLDQFLHLHKLSQTIS